MIVFLFSERIPGIKKATPDTALWIPSSRPKAAGIRISPPGDMQKNSKHCLCTDTGQKNRSLFHAEKLTDFDPGEHPLTPSLFLKTDHIFSVM